VRTARLAKWEAAERERAHNDKAAANDQRREQASDVQRAEGECDQCDAKPKPPVNKPARSPKRAKVAQETGHPAKLRR
jgi:hypothetical protein